MGDAAHAGAGLVVSGALTNNAVLKVAAGKVDVVGTVTGTGSAVIGGGSLEFDAGFTQNVGFTGTTGVLELAKSQAYNGAISGFSLTGGTSRWILATSALSPGRPRRRSSGEQGQDAGRADR